MPDGNTLRQRREEDARRSHNNEVVLAEFHTPRAPATSPGRVILVKRDDPRPYVTWWENMEAGGRVWGHYFAPDEYEAAVRDFVARVERHMHG